MDVAVRPWLEASGALERRRDARCGVLCSARISAGGSTFRCAVRDISPRGARVQLGTPIVDVRSSAVELLIDGLGPRWSNLLAPGALRGEIVWQRAATLGIEFAVDPRRAAAIVDAALTL